MGDKIVIVFSGVELTKELRAAIGKIPNAELKEEIKDIDKATHIIVTGEGLDKVSAINNQDAAVLRLAS